MNLLTVQRTKYMYKYEAWPNMADHQSCTHVQADFSNLLLAALFAVSMTTAFLCISCTWMY